MSASVNAARADAPQVQESPAAEAVPVHRRGDVRDLILAQQLPPHQAPRQVAAGRPAQRRDGGRQAGPPVDAGQVLQPDQLRQQRQAGDVGQRRGPHRGLRVGQQPGVGVEVHRPPDGVQCLQPQRPRVGLAAADPHDGLVGPGVGGGAPHDRRLTVDDQRRNRTKIPGSWDRPRRGPAPSVRNTSRQAGHSDPRRSTCTR